MIQQTRTRDTWLAERETAIGASEMPSLFGCGFETPYELYARKLGALPQIDETEAMEVGTLIQPTIAELLRRRTNIEVREADQHEFIRHPDYPFMGCTPDAWVYCEERGMGVGEFKNVGQYLVKEWEDQPPLKVQVQVQGQLACTGLKWGVVASLIGGNKFVWRIIERDEKFIAVLVKQCKDFWWRISEKIPPEVDGDPRTTAALFALHPDDSGASVELPTIYADYAAELAQLDIDIKASEERKAELQNMVRAAIGDATYATLPDGSGWSWKRQERKAHYVSESTSRVLRRTKAKGK